MPENLLWLWNGAVWLLGLANAVRDVLEPCRWLILGIAIFLLAADCLTTTIFLKIPGDRELTRFWVRIQTIDPKSWPAIFMALTSALALVIFLIWPPGLLVLIAIQIRWVVNNVLLIERTEPHS